MFYLFMSLHKVGYFTVDHCIIKPILTSRAGDLLLDKGWQGWQIQVSIFAMPVAFTGKYWQIWEILANMI